LTKLAVFQASGWAERGTLNLDLFILPINHNRAVLIKSFGKIPLFSALKYGCRFGVDLAATG
jgi:hypothetical protein